jgi:hypothetical protein
VHPLIEPDGEARRGRESEDCDESVIGNNKLKVRSNEEV